MLKVEVSNAATPAVNATGPSGVAPSKNFTVPIGIPTPGAIGETVAVNVTACPGLAGLTELVTIVSVAARLTVCARIDDVLVVKLPLPR